MMTNWCYIRNRHIQTQNNQISFCVETIFNMNYLDYFTYNI